MIELQILRRTTGGTLISKNQQKACPVSVVPFLLSGSWIFIVGGTIFPVPISAVLTVGLSAD